MTEEKCPLCGCRVVYRGLNNLECVGRRCENYKPSELDKFREQLNDLSVDFPWFMAFGDWLGNLVGTRIRTSFDPEVNLARLEAPDLGAAFTWHTAIPDYNLTRRQLWDWLSTYNNAWKRVLADHV